MALSAPVKALNVQRSPINSFTQMSFQAWNADWFPLPGQAVFDRNTQKIAAVSRDPGNLDLFVIGNDAERSRLDHGLEQRHWLERGLGPASRASGI